MSLSRFVYVIFGIMILVSSYSHAEERDWNYWNIRVYLYRGYPEIESFDALKQLAIISVEELGNGFLVKSNSYREHFNGATFCLRISPELHDAELQRQRILNRVRSLQPEGQFVEFAVYENSSCIPDPNI